MKDPAAAPADGGAIVVVNPNSNRSVTAGLDASLADLRFADGPAVECHTLEEGPFGIESQIDADSVVLPLVRFVEARPEAAAFVIACYSDPGIDACRSVARVPVFGIQESGVLAALALGDRFGVLAIAEPSIVRHRRYLRRLDLLGRLAGERALGISVDESAHGEHTFARLVETGGRLIEEDGADVLVLGCAGMAAHRAPLERALGRPVVEPTRAAVAQALGVVPRPAGTGSGARGEG